MSLNWSAPSIGLSQFSRCLVYISTTGVRSFKIPLSSNIPARTTVVSSESPLGLVFRPNSGVPITFVSCLSSPTFSMIQTTVRAEVILNSVSTIRCLWHFLGTSRDLQVCSFDDEVVAIGCPCKLATVDTVAQCLMECNVRLGYKHWILQTVLTDARGWPTYSIRTLPQKQPPTAIFM